MNVQLKQNYSISICYWDALVKECILNAIIRMMEANIRILTMNIFFCF